MLSFNGNIGIPVDCITSTGKYTLLKLTNTDIVLTVNNSLYEVIKDDKAKSLLLNGTINIYDNFGKYLVTSVIRNNKIENL